MQKHTLFSLRACYITCRIVRTRSPFTCALLHNVFYSTDPWQSRKSRCVVHALHHVLVPAVCSSYCAAGRT
jgi:hypothetical protein